MMVVSVFLVIREKDLPFSSGEACLLEYLGGLLAVTEAEPHAGLRKTSEDAFWPFEWDGHWRGWSFSGAGAILLSQKRPCSLTKSHECKLLFFFFFCIVLSLVNCSSCSFVSFLSSLDYLCEFSCGSLRFLMMAVWNCLSDPCIQWFSFWKTFISFLWHNVPALLQGTWWGCFSSCALEIVNTSWFWFTRLEVSSLSLLSVRWHCSLTCKVHLSVLPLVVFRSLRFAPSAACLRGVACDLWKPTSETFGILIAACAPGVVCRVLRSC